jgi:hypothetical protein
MRIQCIILINANLRGCFRVLACFPCTKMAAAHTTVQAPHMYSNTKRYRYRCAARSIQASSLLGVLGGLLQRGRTVVVQASSLLGVLGGLLQRAGTVAVQASSLLGLVVLDAVRPRAHTWVVLARYLLPRALALTCNDTNGRFCQGHGEGCGYDYALVTWLMLKRVWMRTLLLVGDQQLNGYGMHEHVYISFIECAEYAC